MADEARNITADAAENTCGRPSRDYLLVVGPGRSGSTFLYRLLNRHPAFSAPRIKEGHYYRSPGRFEEALRKARENASPVLLDVSNLAWRDLALPGGVKTLMTRGHRVLLVVLLRDHPGRAASMARHRRSRGEPSALLGRRTLERAITRDSLTPEDLMMIFEIGADVLVVGFEALVGNTAEILDHLARLCGTADFEASGAGPANQAVQARSVALSAAGKLTATALRTMGCLRLLQRLKDNPFVMRLFFRPDHGDTGLKFSPETESRLVNLSTACRHTVEQAGERLAADLWLMRAEAGPAPDTKPPNP